MKFDNYALPSIKIKSNWFDGKDNMFKKIGKEEGLNLYLQLFRFRLHQGKYDEHVFRVTIGELKEFTKMNCKTKLRNNQVFDLLKKMSRAGIIELHKPVRWNYLVDENDKIKPDTLIVLKAIDVPHTYKGADKNGVSIDSPTTDNDYYITINFNTIDYIYNDLSLTSKEVSVYLLMLKLSNNSEHKANININKIENWLGYSDDTITNILITLNENYLLATHTKKNGKKINFEHVPLRSYSRIETFKRDADEIIQKFLKRYGKAENKEYNPFDDIEEDIDSENWGSSPNGYDQETGEIKFDLTQS
ncbi:hypothetical protein GCM10008983_06530 [Lentibacillus halophilus]|uniref:Replication protein n=1 Tax=Lentibacillus halophilus TaxID=295065 RepID=A0ABN0Z475_9BACI